MMSQEGETETAARRPLQGTPAHRSIGGHAPMKMKKTTTRAVVASPSCLSATTCFSGSVGRCTSLQTSQVLGCTDKRPPGLDDTPDSDAAGTAVVNLLKSTAYSSEVDFTFCQSRPVSSLNHAWIDPMLQESNIKAAGHALQSSTAEPPTNPLPEASVGGNLGHITDQQTVDEPDAHGAILMQ
jgi:hypothetical protein